MTAYNNNIYGLIIMLIFFILLTIGLVYELGKKALTINSKQYNNFK
jgi:NADH-ubiquinone oxidoreductase chain 3